MIMRDWTGTFTFYAPACYVAQGPFGLTPVSGSYEGNCRLEMTIEENLALAAGKAGGISHVSRQVERAIP